MVEYFMFTDRISHIYRLTYNVPTYPNNEYDIKYTIDVFRHPDNVITGISLDMIDNICSKKVGILRRNISYVTISADDFNKLQLGIKTSFNIRDEGYGLLGYLGIFTLQNSCMSIYKKTKELNYIHSNSIIDWNRVDTKFYSKLSCHERSAVYNWLSNRHAYIIINDELSSPLN
jgi:hypothetical protein